MNRQRRPFRTKGWVPLSAIPTKVEAPVPARPKTEAERNAEIAEVYYQAHLRREQATADEEKRKADTERAEQQRRQQEAHNQRRQAEFDSAEFQIKAVFDQYGLTPDERTQIEDAITERQLWSKPLVAVEYATVAAMEITARRQQAIQRRIAKLRDLCDDAEWQQIETLVARNRQHFTDDAEAYEVIWNRLNNF